MVEWEERGSDEDVAYLLRKNLSGLRLCDLSGTQSDRPLDSKCEKKEQKEKGKKGILNSVPKTRPGRGNRGRDKGISNQLQRRG